MTPLAYLRVSTEEQAESGAGLDAQRLTIRQACEARGWNEPHWREDAGESGGIPWELRPALSEAVKALNSGEYGTLVVAKLDRLSRSVLDFAHIMAESKRHGWALVCLDLGVDTTTPAGELVANVMASFAQFERRLIAQRTREGMAAKRAQGVHTGRRSVLPCHIVERIRRERAEPRSLQAIADRLNADEIATGQGAPRWSKGAVAAVLRSKSHATV